MDDIINELSVKSLEEVIQSYNKDSQEFVNEYINILLKNEFGFITKNSWDYSFPSISYKYQAPNTITNAYLEIDNFNYLDKIKEELSTLGTEYLVLHYNQALSIEDFKFIEKIFENSTISSIEIFSKYSKDVDRLFINSIEYFCKRIHHLVFYLCDHPPFKVKDEFKFLLTFYRHNITRNSCGKVKLKYFNTNFHKITESMNHNSCLHKKISIDKDGEIKNCPAMSQTFGNIKNVSLEQAFNHIDFKKYWNLTKNNIEVCKDCEFRYICTDCRAYTEKTHINDEGLDTSKPLKCGYDPYSGKWEEWSKNPLKQTAISYYKL